MGQSYIIKRPRLTKLLDESQARIILLCAPAGYGKTTLAREWIATRSEPVAWYRGGPEMLDVAAVAQSLAQAMLGIGASQALEARVTATAAATSAPDALARALISGIPESTGAILVIDDYQYCEGGIAENLIAALVESTDLRVILTSRTRPSWLAPRLCVYGEAFVVGMHDLAFTADEARDVLALGSGSQGQELLDRARGWPAVIGLAANGSVRSAPDLGPLMPEELYNYIAEDIFRSIPQDLQRRLFVIALAGDMYTKVATTLLPGALAATLADAVERGFVAQAQDGRTDLHPLIRAFLVAKLHELPPREIEKIVKPVAAELTAHRAWDIYLDVAREFPGVAPMARPLHAALAELLASGRIATVERWLNLAPSGSEEPIVLLAKSEIALREGANPRAQALAALAADGAQDDDLAARAHLVAARAAHLRGDERATMWHAGEVHEATAAPDLAFAARWIEYLSALEGQRPEARGILEDLRRLENPTPEQSLRLLHATAFVALEVDGRIKEALDQVSLARELLPLVSDPISRTSFMNIALATMVYAAEYERALDAADEQIAEAEATGLQFVADHALIGRAAAFIGLRRLSAARRVLDELSTRVDTVSSFVEGQIRLKMARLWVTAGDLRRAEITLRTDPPGDLPRAFGGEWLGTRAICLAALGETHEAKRIAQMAEDTSAYADARDLVEMTRLMMRISAGSAGAQSAFLEDLIERRYLDALVLTCRALPAVAAYAAQFTHLRGELTRLLSASQDVDIARAAGLEMPRELRTRERLSRRERDVYDLLINGRSNREIARTLFISESTAKVHVRHILEKLGVHSRVEAAALARNVES